MSNIKPGGVPPGFFGSNALVCKVFGIKMKSGQLFFEALEFHRRGQFGEATRRYKKIIKRDPNHIDALHHLGMASYALGLIDEAMGYYNICIQIDPEFAPVYNSLAAVLLHQGNNTKALEFAERSISKNSTTLNAHILRGRALGGLGRLDDALKSYQLALINYPLSHDAYNNMGLIYLSQGRLVEARDAFTRAINLSPNFTLALYNRASTLFKEKQKQLAADDMQRAISLDPHNIHFLVFYSQILLAQENFLQAKEHADLAWKLDPTNQLCLFTMIKALLGTKEYNEVVRLSSELLAHSPGDALTINAMGVAFVQLGRFREAREKFTEALSIEPENYDVKFNLACLQLLLGELKEGFKNYESRKVMSDPYGQTTFSKPTWSGSEEINDKVILVTVEQGLGDVFQFVRYLPLLAARGAQVLLGNDDESLRSVLGDLGCGVMHVSATSPEKNFDFHCSLMSLPMLSKTELDTIPNKVPYILHDASRVNYWRSVIGEHGFKVGICWQGSKSGLGFNRSVSLSHFFPISELNSIRLISLQKGAGEEQIEQLGSKLSLEVLGDKFDNGPDAFVDTAAVMSLCDLVITIDTSIAHLAGAMSVPVWVILKKVPDWRWFLDRSDSPWYPSMRLFRPANDGDLGDVFKYVEIALKRLLKNH